MHKFYTENATVLQKYSESISLTQEQIDIMLVDDDAFYSFLRNNFSSEFYTICENFIEMSAATRASVEVSTANLNIAELTLVEKMVVLRDYKDLVIDVVSNQKPLTKKEKRELCLGMFRSATDKCNKAAAKSFLLILFSNFISPITAVNLFVTAQDLNDCVENARKDYNTA